MSVCMSSVYGFESRLITDTGSRLRKGDVLHDLLHISFCQGGLLLELGRLGFGDIR